MISRTGQICIYKYKNAIKILQKCSLTLYNYMYINKKTLEMQGVFRLFSMEFSTLKTTAYLKFSSSEGFSSLARAPFS